ncbi:MAG: PP2C family protein-serine/threonine phosphatase [Pyrinomonadaceae bacterium]
MFNSTGGQHYVTFFYASFDHANRRLTYVNAGHNPPLYLRSNESPQFQRLTAGGLIAGVFEHSHYDQESLQMQPDDLLFLYTDGLSEAMNSAGEELGETRIKETLAACVGLTVNEIRDQIVCRVKDWCKGVSLHDDLTFVVLKVS